MTLEEAYAITDKMTMNEHRNPNSEQSTAKWVIYREVIVKKYANEKGEVPPHLEPDYMEGWK